MAFFKLGSDKKTVVFSEHSKKHGGKTIEQVAREDPKYLQWARRERTVGIAPEVFDAIDDAMRMNGVPFTVGRKKSSPPKRS